MSGFHAKLNAAWRSTGSMLCVGLDPDLDRLPLPLRGAPDAIERFCIAIVDATAAVASAFKPQIAYFASQRAEGALENVCGYIREAYPQHVLVLDAKRGDIGPTAEHYAREAFVRYGADVVTVNPYLGTDSVEPFLRHDGKGVLFLCRTSNPGGDDFQSLVVDGQPLYTHVARRVAEHWTTLGECGLVVGATYPSEIGVVRDIVGDLPLLIPGVGAQGGDALATVKAGWRSSTGGSSGETTAPIIVSSSRAVLYASSGPDFVAAARQEASKTRALLEAAKA